MLIPDFCGDWSALQTVLDARPDILNHNIESVPRLYKVVRPQAKYRRSLELLQRAKAQGFVTKTGMMLGLGEEEHEIDAVLDDLVSIGCDILTLGQYLQPTAEAPARRALGASRRVRVVEGPRRGEGPAARRIRTAGALELPRGEAGPGARSAFARDARRVRVSRRSRRAPHPQRARRTHRRRTRRRPGAAHPLRPDAGGRAGRAGQLSRQPEVPQAARDDPRVGGDRLAQRRHASGWRCSRRRTRTSPSPRRSSRCTGTASTRTRASTPRPTSTRPPPSARAACCTPACSSGRGRRSGGTASCTPTSWSTTTACSATA